MQRFLPVILLFSTLFSCESTVRKVGTDIDFYPPYRLLPDVELSAPVSPYVFYAPKFSPDGSMLMTLSSDFHITLWNLKTGGFNRICGYSDPNSPELMYWAEFLPDGKHIIGGGHYTGLGVWDLNGKREKSFGLQGESITDFELSPSGDIFATSHSDNSIRIWSTNFNLIATVAPSTNHINDIAFTSDGKAIVVAYTKSGVRVYNLLGERTGGIADGKSFYFLEEKDGAYYLINDEGELHILSKNGELINWIKVPEQMLCRLTVSPNGQTVAAGTDYGEIALYNTALKKIQMQKLCSQETLGLCFDSTGRYLAVCTRDYAIRLIDLKSGDAIVLCMLQNGEAFTFHSQSMRFDCSETAKKSLKMRIVSTGKELPAYKPLFRELIDRRYMRGLLKQFFDGAIAPADKVINEGKY